MLSVVTYPNSILRKTAEPVESFDDDLKILLDQMADAMYVKDGVGLAAPQVGISKRIIVVDIGEGLLCLVNPEILAREGEEKVLEEGCLSLPGVRVDVSRPEKITVAGFDEKGGRIEKNVLGLNARVFQHEIDHLNGVLIIDRLNTLQRVLLKSKLKRLHETA